MVVDDRLILPQHDELFWCCLVLSCLFFSLGDSVLLNFCFRGARHRDSAGEQPLLLGRGRKGQGCRGQQGASCCAVLFHVVVVFCWSPDLKRQSNACSPTCSQTANTNGLR